MRRPAPLARLNGRGADATGLSASEIEARRATFGPNDIAEAPPGAFWDLLRDTARDPMIAFLIATSGLYGALGQGAEALTLLAASVPLVGMDAWLHRRTRASTEALASRLAQRARVVRDGAAVEVAARELVPGDLVIVSAGEPFPADGLLVSGAELQVDESALTGESSPARKRPLAALPGDAAEPAIEEVHWGLAGTRLLTGRSSVRVVYTGGDTLYGEIVRSAVGGEGGPTPLQAALGRLVSVLVVAAAFLCLGLALVRVRQGHGWLDALVSALTLAVAALPEEFPVVFTFFLGVGVYRLSKRQALVRRAVSVENVGRVSCICSDKTGTVTEGILLVTHLEPSADGSEDRLLAVAADASRADSGDPLDRAILARLAERPPGGSAPLRERLATFPFTEDRRRETAIVREGDARLAVAKGSPEVVLARCALAEDERRRWAARVDALAEGAHKVLACAARPLADGEPTRVEPEDGYRFEGLVACEDPIREGVAEAVADCARAGIHTVLVTGDHPLTARAVAREIGLGGGAPKVVAGDELEAFLAAPSGGDPRRLHVVARAVPAHKLTLVRAFQQRGEVVAVTGDGVNDVPALRAADVGIAMGERATRSAREVAAIVLLDDSFRTLVRAIAEGRQLFVNLRLAFSYLLLVHLPLVATAALVPLAGHPLLYLPVHVVWLELLIHPTALLVFQDLPPSARLAPRRRTKRARFFSPAEWGVIAVVALTGTLLVGGAYVRGLGAEGADVEHARALAVATLALVHGAVAATLSGLRTRVARLVVLSTVGLSVALIQIPALARRLHVSPLHLDDWLGLVLGVAAAVWLPLALALRLRARGRARAAP